MNPLEMRSNLPKKLSRLRNESIRDEIELTKKVE
jgi:hypothetical protein